MFRYRAFGFVIESEFEIKNMITAEPEEAVDIRVVHAHLLEQGISFEKSDFRREVMTFKVTGLAYFRVTGGELIEIETVEIYDPEHLAVFIMGAGLGAILHQRGAFVIHGGCVTNGEKTLIIIGVSGAGKSTMASEFLSHGWKLLSDDVSVIKNAETVPLVQSSYPSQKLWPDSLKQYQKDSRNVHVLYQENGDSKFGIDVSNVFVEGTAPLSMVVRLVAAEEGVTGIYPVEGFTRVHQLGSNIYRGYMIDPRDKQRSFQQCVDLGMKIPMVVAFRKKGENTATLLYEEIVKYLENL